MLYPISVNILWDALQWLSKLNFLGDNWNIIGVIWAIFIFAYTFRKLKPLGYGKVKMILLSLIAVIAIQSFYDSFNSIVLMAVRPDLASYILQATMIHYFDFISSSVAIWLSFGNKLNFRSNLSIICFLYLALYNLPTGFVLDTGRWRSLPDPYSTYYWLAFYIPAYAIQALMYVGLWRKPRQLLFGDTTLVVS